MNRPPQFRIVFYVIVSAFYGACAYVVSARWPSITPILSGVSLFHLFLAFLWMYQRQRSR